jgi:hypothetical protein
MHEFDKFIINEIEKEILEKNIIEKRAENTPRPTEYQNIANQLDYARNRLKTAKKNLLNRPIQVVKEKIQYNYQKIQKLNKQLIRLPSITIQKKKLKIIYVRYADDWILLTNAKKEYTIYLKEKISTWLKTELHLTLSTEKTKITDLTKKAAKFLGFNVYIRNIVKVRKLISKTGTPYNKRVSGWNIATQSHT